MLPRRRQILSTTWLWDKIRVQGGPYGGFCALDQRSGNFTYLSYRDPNLLETLDIYDQTPRFLKRAEIDKTSRFAGVGTSATSMPINCQTQRLHLDASYLAGETDEIRQRRRDEMLGANIADFRAFADALAELTACGRVVVLGSERPIGAVSALRPGF